MKWVILLLIILAIFAFSIALGANNDQVVNFNYLLDQGQFRLSTLVGLLLGSGFFLGWLVTSIFYVKAKLSLNAIQRKFKKLEKLYDAEVANSRKHELMDNATALTTTKD